MLDGADPSQQAFLRAAFSPNRFWQLDGVARYVGELKSLGVDAYLTADLRASWNFYGDFWLTLVGRNLAQPHHYEQAGASATAVERSVHGQVEWRR